MSDEITATCENSERVAVKDVKRPADWAVRKKQPSVDAFMKNFKRYPVLLEPIIVTKDLQLVCGRDRLAAFERLGIEYIDARILDGTPREVRMAILHENMTRRHNTKEQRDHERKLMQMYMEEEPDSLPRSPGRPKKKETKAREKLAREMGVTPDALKKRHERAQQAEARRKLLSDERKSKQSVGVLPEGIAWASELQGETALLQTLMREARRGCSTTQTKLTALKNSEIQWVQPDKIESFYRDVKRIGDWLRYNMPDRLCPYCKAAPIECTGCENKRWITVGQAKGIPAELKDFENPIVIWDGEKCPLQDVLDKVAAEEEPPEEEEVEETDEEAVEDDYVFGAV